MIAMLGSNVRATAGRGATSRSRPVAVARRRAHLWSAILGVSLGIGACSYTSSGGDRTRESAQLANAPNVVLVLLDDLELEAFGHMSRTQALVADSGVRFDSAFVSAPICCPSRVSLLRGQYAQNTGVLANGGQNGGFAAAYRLGVETSTLATWLRGAGYRTGLFGKYLNFYPERKNPRYVPPGWSRWAVPVEGDPYGGYDYVLNFDGTLQRYGSREEEYATDVLRDLALNFVRESSRANVPFFALISTFAPHAPSTPAARHAEMFEGAAAPRTPATAEVDLSDKPSFMRDLPSRRNAQLEARMDAQYRRRLQSLQAVDEAVEHLVATLRDLGELERTLFIVTSDNGFHFGSHGLMMGKETPYEEDLRVPLVMRGPGIAPGHRVSATALNIDLAPTIVDLAGITPDVAMDGRSLSPLLRGAHPATWRQGFLITRDLPEHLKRLGERLSAEGEDGLAPPPDFGRKDSRGATRQGTDDLADGTRAGDQRGGVDLTTAERRAYTRIKTYPSFRGVRTVDGWLFVRHETGDEELYDLSRDPHQLQNLAVTRPTDGAVTARLADLRAWTEELSRCAGRSCRTLEDRGPVLLLQAAAKPD